MPKLRFPGFEGEWEYTKLGNLAVYGRNKTRVTKSHYVSTENIEQNFGGIVPFEDSETMVDGTEFTKRDVLIANIRPYLKKYGSLIWMGIATQKELIETLKKYKRGRLSTMFLEKDETIPKHRFSGFTEPWEQRKLGEMMNVTSVKRIHQSDWTDSGVRFLRARDIVAASKNEEPDDYLYISKEKYEEFSAISGKVDIDDLLVMGVGTIGVPYLVENTEPLYFKDGNIIWFQNRNEIDGKFLYYSFIGNGIQSFIKASAGTGTVGTYTIDTGKKTPIQLPLKDEQKKIGEYFTIL